VTLCAEARSVTVPADREFLSRALANLIDNALKYGGTTITVATRAVDGWGEVVVSDDGPGIPEQDRARVVERFVRLDNARTRAGGGLGLAGRGDDQGGVGCLHPPRQRFEKALPRRIFPDPAIEPGEEFACLGIENAGHAT